MVLLDTNVLSAVMSSRPDANVLRWLGIQDTHSVFLSSVTIAEVAYGLASLPRGRKRQSLGDALERFLALGFQDRILDFDVRAARLYGELMNDRKKAGRPMSMADGQIASIAKVSGLALATRNVKDFQGCGVPILNPYDEASSI